MRVRVSNLAVAAVLAAATATPALATGNGALSGSHYNLNLIGHNDCLGNDFIGSNRHVIAVLLNYNDGSQNGTDYATLNPKNKIFLEPGDSFQVLDGSACDGAYFQLPQDVSSAYYVFIRALGSPKGLPTGTITTCAVDSTNTIVCSTADDVVNLTRTKGKSTFTNVTKQLLNVCVDLNLSGTCENNELVPLFDEQFQTYFWDYDNNGIRNAQLRFSPVP
jgi:hypothetical protein